MGFLQSVHNSFSNSTRDFQQILSQETMMAGLVSVLWNQALVDFEIFWSCHCWRSLTDIKYLTFSQKSYSRTCTKALRRTEKKVLNFIEKIIKYTCVRISKRLGYRTRMLEKMGQRGQHNFAEWGVPVNQELVAYWKNEWNLEWRSGWWQSRSGLHDPREGSRGSEVDWLSK